MDPILEVIKQIGMQQLDGDKMLLQLINKLVDRHIELELRVERLESRIPEDEK